MKKSGANNKISYDRRVESQDIPNLDHLIRRRIKIAIETKLATYPEIYGEPLHAKLARYWKLRVGDWRVIYELSNKEVVIHIIGHRANIYKIVERRLK